MKKGILTLFFFIAICFIVFLLFRNINFQEGLENNMTTSSSSNTSNVSVTNGIAGSAQNYGADIKSETIRNQDILLISKYRHDYENVILSLDDLVNTMMLQTTLSVDKKNPMTALDKLVKLNSVKTALNSVMKYVDSSA
jgi:hypothetical protein